VVRKDVGLRVQRVGFKVDRIIEGIVYREQVIGYMV
jgi:hypothetical protein